MRLVPSSVATLREGSDYLLCFQALRDHGGDPALLLFEESDSAIACHFLHTSTHTDAATSREAAQTR